MASLPHFVPYVPHGEARISHALIQSGVPLETVALMLADAGLEPKDIHDVILPARTLAHRRARNEHLSREESDRFARLIRIYDHTLSIFGSRDKVLRFLRLPKMEFEGRSPLQMLATDLGGRMVEDMLWGIADGVFV